MRAQSLGGALRCLRSHPDWEPHLTPRPSLCREKCVPFPALLGPMVPTAHLYAAVAMAAPVPLWMAPALVKRVSFPSALSPGSGVPIAEGHRRGTTQGQRVCAGQIPAQESHSWNQENRSVGQSPGFGVAESTERESQPHGLLGQNGETEFPEPGQETCLVGTERALWGHWRSTETRPLSKACPRRECWSHLSYQRVGCRSGRNCSSGLAWATEKSAP